MNFEKYWITFQFYFENIVNYLNDHASLLSVIITGFIAFLTYHLVNENRAIRKAGTNPEIIAYLIPHPNGNGGINFVIENVGAGVAKDISFKFAYDKNDFKSHNVKLNNDRDRAKFIFLPANEKIIALFGVFPDLAGSKSNNKLLKPFDIILKYRDIRNRNYNKTYILDLSSYVGLCGIFEKPVIVKISDNIFNINNTLKKLLLLHPYRMSQKNTFKTRRAQVMYIDFKKK